MSTATSATTRTAKCEACGMSFNGEKGVTLHLASSTICPKSTKYDAEAAKEKDTKCTHCGLPCRGEKGLETHLRRSNTCPGGRKALAPKEEKAEKKERKTEKKTEKTEKKEKKEDKKTEKKDEERTVRGRGSSRGGRGSARGGRGSGRGGRATGAKRDEKPVAEKRTEKKTVEKKTEKKPAVEKKVGDTPCPDCKKLFVGETGLKAHKARSFCGKTEEEKATITKERAAKKSESGEKKVAAKKSEKKAGEKKPVEKKPAVEYKEVACEGCSGKFNERSIVAHQTNSTICPKSAKYNKESAAAAEARKKEAEIPKDTECKSCKSLHRGEKALAIHLAKSTTCPASAKYVKSE